MLSSSTRLNMKERMVACIVRPGGGGKESVSQSWMEGERERDGERGKGWLEGVGERRVGRFGGRVGYREGGRREDWKVAYWLCERCRSQLKTHAA